MDSKINIPSDIEIKRGSLFYQMPVLFLGVGIGCLTYWSMLAQNDHVRAMFGYLFGFTVVLSLALGSLSFVLMQFLTRAGWSVVIRRIPETVMAILPLFIFLFIPIAIFAHDIFPWLHPEHIDAILEKKLGYLNERFFLWRSFGYLVVWGILGTLFYRVSLAQDRGGKADLTKFLQGASAPAVVIFGLTVTFASVDWLMSLQPHWYSTIFGVYFWAGCILFAFSFTTLMAMTLQKAGVLATAITGEHYHDLGKLMFGFTVFWAYIAFSQFMLYWYGAVPEEVEFYSHRLHNGWETLSWALPLINFFVPFFGLMSRTLKRVKLILAINCVWVILVHLADLYWLILPTYHDPNVEHGPPPLLLSLVDVLPTIGIFSLFFGVFLFVLSRHKILAVGDPRLPESLAFENY